MCLAVAFGAAAAAAANPLLPLWPVSACGGMVGVAAGAGHLLMAEQQRHGGLRPPLQLQLGCPSPRWALAHHGGPSCYQTQGCAYLGGSCWARRHIVHSQSAALLALRLRLLPGLVQGEDWVDSSSSLPALWVSEMPWDLLFQWELQRHNW